MSISKFLDPKNDVAFRRIFVNEKNKDILILFINDVLELKDGNRIKEVTFLSTIQEPEIAAKKQSIVDVLCKDENGVQIHSRDASIFSSWLWERSELNIMQLKPTLVS